MTDYYTVKTLNAAVFTIIQPFVRTMTKKDNLSRRLAMVKNVVHLLARQLLIIDAQI